MKYRIQRAVLGGKPYQMVEVLPGVEGADRFVICADSSGNRFVCPEEVWTHSPDAVQQAADLPASAAPVRPGAGAAVSGRSRRDEQIARRIGIFLARFRGRGDVYARRFESRKGTRGYSFACRNEWNPNICEKQQKRKCSLKCRGCSLLPMTEEVVRKHLLGTDPNCGDVLGAYPLEEGNVTRFLAMDLDKASWQEDVTALRETCREIGVTPAVERSRSGNGAHVWFFFSEPVPAVSARQFGSGLLTRTMARRHELSFESYDRMFPSQDTLPDGGLGNLIALPLQGRARKQGNSVFVDESFVPYPKQWDFLEGLPLIRPDELEAFLFVLGDDADLGATTPAVESGGKKSLLRRREPRRLQRRDFPARVQIILRNMVFVEKEGLSQKAMDAIHRLAVLPNPEFYSRQRRRIPMNQYGKIDTPRIFDCGYEDADFLGIPRGGWPALKSLLESSGVSVEVRDERNSGRPIAVSFTGELRPEQAQAANALLGREIGVLQAATAFGKTVVAAYLIGQKKVNTLILVHTNALQEQWRKALEQFLDIQEARPEEPEGRGRKRMRTRIGQLGGGKQNCSGIVDIANLQSLFVRTETERTVKTLIEEYGMIIVDECHHGAAQTYEKVLKAAPARCVYGLTATPKRKDRLEPIIFLQCGPIVYRSAVEQSGEERGFFRYVMPRFTRMRLPETATIQDSYRAMIGHAARNEQILKDASEAIARGRTPILLTERTEHARILAAGMADRADHVLLMIGSEKAREKREKLEILQQIPAEESLAVVATGSYVGEGFDLPRLDTLLLTMPISWEGRLEQYAGRLHRGWEGKTEVMIYDYVDIRVPMLERMYRRRLKGYGKIGYRIWSGRPEEAISRIFTGQEWREQFRDDLNMARKSIRIVSPYLQKEQIQALLPDLKVAAGDGAEVVVYTRLPEGPSRQAAEACVEVLKREGIQVLVHSRYQQCCAVMDGATVWHGSICFLGAEDEDDSTFRFVNAEVAGELMDAVENCRNGTCGEQMMLDL